MEGLKQRQQTDGKQGGEGTNSFHNKSYDPLFKDINADRGKPGNTEAEVPPITQGTK